MSDFIREKKTEIRENRIETASTLSKSNPKEINQSRDTKSIKIDVSLEDHQYLSEQAKQRKISTRSYVKMKALDRETGPGMRAREIVHFQRFGEGLRLAKEKMDQKNVYAVNPAFDRT